MSLSENFSGISGGKSPTCLTSPSGRVGMRLAARSFCQMMARCRQEPSMYFRCSVKNYSLPC